MTSKFLNLTVMGFLFVVLIGILYAFTLGRSATAIAVPWLVLGGAVLVAGVLAFLTSTARRAWGIFSALNGAISWSLAIVVTLEPLPEWAPYREGVPSDRVEFALPWSAMLRAAVASGYFGIAAAAVGLTLTGATIFLFWHRNEHREL